MKGRYVLLIVVFLVAGFVVSNRMSYADGISDQQLKCDMIAEKSWPNVDNFYEKHCNEQH